MTTLRLRKLPHGTKVQWHRPDDPSSDAEGYVCCEHRKAHPSEDVYIQWEDGQRTYAFDDWALEHVIPK